MRRKSNARWQQEGSWDASNCTTRLPSGVLSCEYANTIRPIAMLFGGFLALLVEPPVLSWAPPAIVPIPSKLGVA
jgi:hypothetical protein